MKKRVLGYSLILFGGLTVGALNADAQSVDMHRMYNPGNGEHFYTGNVQERDWLISIKWGNYEGIGWKAPTSGDKVYRLYNKGLRDHHYTKSWDEVTWLTKNYGWTYEGEAWKSAPKNNKPVYRLFHPYMKTGSHHYTMSWDEVTWLTKNHGWKYEGVGWYAAPDVKPEPPVATVNKEPLKTLINKVQGTSSTQYTSDSWKTFNTALADAKKVLNNSKATQTQVNTAKTNLEKAFNNLKIQYYKVTVKHVDDKGNVLKQTSEDVKKGTSYTAKAQSISGYTLQGDSTQKAAVNANKTFTFTYKKNTADSKVTVTVKHLDTNGYDISDPEVFSVNKGTEYTAESKTFAGFRVRGAATQNKKVDENTTFEFVYDQVHNVQIKHVDGNGQLLDSSTDVVVHDTNYTAEAKTIEGYVLEGAATQTKLINYNNYTITFTYLKKFNVEVNHVVEGSGQVLDKQNYEALQGKTFETGFKAFEGYALFGSNAQRIVGVNNNGVITFRYKAVNEITEKVRQEIFNGLNSHRNTSGRQTLAAVPVLNAGADIRANEILLPGHYNHARPNGRVGTSVGEEVGYANYCKTENIWIDLGKDAESIFNQGSANLIAEWKISPSHNAGMLMSDLTESGIGVTVKPNQDGSVNVGYVFLGGRPWNP